VFQTRVSLNSTLVFELFSTPKLVFLKTVEFLLHSNNSSNTEVTEWRV